MQREFGPQDAKRFYDRFGRLQDAQFYERPAFRQLLAHADFEHATSVFELGCGTGRFASDILEHRLGSDARYMGVDISTTMVELASQRLARWPRRAEVRAIDATETLPYADAAFDRYVATYVLDLLPDSVIANVVREAHRVLLKTGKLCVATSTQGVDGISKAVSFLWQKVYAINPSLVGGCRPLEARSWLDRSAWEIEHLAVVCAWGICSEIVIARPI